MDTVEELIKLKALLDQGAITEEEFLTLKKEAFSRNIESSKSDEVLPPKELKQKVRKNPSSGKKAVSKNKKPVQKKQPVNVSKKPIISKGLRNTGIFILIVAILFIIGSPSGKWKKKQFDSYEDLAKAFSGVRYKHVKEEFGEPYYKFLDITQQRISYKWHGVGVKGHQADACLEFDVLEYATGFYMGYQFEVVNTNEGYMAPSNDNTYHIE